MLTRIWTGFLLSGLCASLVALVVVYMHEKGVYPFRDAWRRLGRQPWGRRIAIVAFVVGMWAYASVKPGDISPERSEHCEAMSLEGCGSGGDGGGDGGGINNIQMVIGPGGLPQEGSPGAVTNTLDHGVLGDPAPVVDEWSDFTPITSTNTTRTLTGEDFRRGFVMTQIETGEEHDFSAPPDATIVSDWQAFGAATDWIYVALTNWAFSVATNDVERLRVYSFGKIEPLIREAGSAIATNYWFAPFMASLGVVPEANWSLLNESARPSRVWYCVTHRNTFVVTWENTLLDRNAGSPFSFQVEFWPDDRFVYRYDFSRIDAETVEGILAGASFSGNTWVTNSLPTNVTSMAFCPLAGDDAYNQDLDGDGIATIDELFVHYTDPHNADSDFDGLSDYEELFLYSTNPLNSYSVSDAYCDAVAVRIGGLDPFSFPEGSTNTVLEHIFYSGTTNGVFAYPQSSAEVAILKVMVSGSGTGRLIVGDDVVPLIGFSTGLTRLTGLRGGANPDNPVNPVTNTLLLAVGRGVRREVWFDKPDGLDVALASDDFLIGEMPTWYWAHGWLAFPHTDATVPCIHYFYAKARTVTLVHGEEFVGLAATWKSEDQDVAITNVPPVSAEIHGSFPKDQTRTICYTMSHPDYMGGETNYVQTLRFCPNDVSDPAGEPEDSGDDPYYGCNCAWSGNCNCCTGEWCHCQCWECPCNLNQSPSLVDDAEAEEAFTNAVSGTLMPDVFYLYRDNVRTESLPVPGGDPAHCCPCPEHWQTNYVAKVAYSGRVTVKDAAGEDFYISYEPCTVTLSGVSPSRDFCDSTVVFVTNGVEYSRHNYTVLGVRFESECGRASLSNYNHRSASLGYPVSVCTNLDNAASIVMKTDVLLADGFVRLSMEDASGDIALWLPAWWDSHGTWHPAEPLLQSDGAAVRYMTIRRWRNIIRRYRIQNAVAARIVSSRPSSCRLRLDFIASNGEGYVHDFAAQVVSSVNPLLLGDYNRDMNADAQDVLDQGNSRPLYFWTNHDTWRGDDAFAIYSEGYHAWPITLPDNSTDLVVNGRNDLVNLCPLVVDLSRLASAWGTNGVRYEFYSGDPGNIRFVPIRAKWEALDKIVKEKQTTISNEDLHAATLLTTSSEGWHEIGYQIPQELITLGQSESGVMAVEFTTTGWRNLRIVVSDETTFETLFESDVSVRVLDVHDMYRWLNLDYACNETTGPKYNDKLSVDWPDGEHADANVVFVHGYNVHPSEAWDWSQAMFKRLWWSGMDAGFSAVLWRGNESQVWVPKVPLVNESNGYAARNYHQNVLNAFRTASAFSSRVNNLPGAKKFMIAHSLGNMLVSAARQDYGLQYEQYFMLNAAVAVEAYDPVEGVTTSSYHDMTPKEWRQYPDRVRSTHWYELFLADPNDERGKLTWKGRFKDVDNTINFYSSRDEVVANGGDKVDKLLSREFAWYNQEQAKGNILVSFNPQAGWEFGNHYINVVQEEGLNGETYYSYPKYTPEEALLIAATNLMVRPFFKDFRDEQIYGDGGSAFLLANDMVRWYALSHGIPAESYAAGANPVPKWGEPVTGNILNQQDYGKRLIRNVNMARNCVPDHNEGEINESEKELPWVHSYFIQNSLFDTSVLYEALVEQIGSTKSKEGK